MQNHISLGPDRGIIDTDLWRNVKGCFAQGNLEFDPDNAASGAGIHHGPGSGILIVDDGESSAALFYDGPAVEELSLSDNIYAAGWEPEQFLEHSMVSREENETLETSCPDYFDRDTEKKRRFLIYRAFRTSHFFTL